MRDGERKILGALKDAKTPAGLSFGEILKESGLSRPTVADYLKALQKNNCIVRDVDTRRYRITPKGRGELEKQKGTEMIMENAKAIETPSSFILSPTQLLPAKHVKLESLAIPFSNGKVKAAINVFLALDETNRKNIDFVVKELKSDYCFQGLQNFFYSLGKALSKRQEHFYEGYSREGYWKEPFRLGKLLATVRSQCDFDATLMVTFSGKEATQKIDWDKLQEHVPDIEKKDEEEWREQKKRIEKREECHRAWLENVMMSALGFFDRSPRGVSGSLAEFEDSFVKYIMREKRGEFPKPASENDIRQGLELLKREGIIRITARTEYAFDVDEQKAESREKTNIELLKS